MAMEADGLLIMMPFQVTGAPRVFVQLAGVATVESQMALSPAPGAVPLTQLVPNSRFVLLFVLDLIRVSDGRCHRSSECGQKQRRKTKEWRRGSFMKCLNLYLAQFTPAPGECQAGGTFYFIRAAAGIIPESGDSAGWWRVLWL